MNICDNYANRVRTVNSFGIISLTAGTNIPGYAGDTGPPTAASLVDCQGIAVDSSGNLYVADTGNRRIRRISAAGIVTTVAGNGTAGFSGDGGPAVGASLSLPQGAAVDGAGNLYIADTNNNRIRKVSSSGTITTIAGNGNTGYGGDGAPAVNALLNGPSRITLDSAGNIYLTDNGNNVVRAISTQGIIRTVAGNGQYGFSGDGGQATAASLADPLGLAIDPAGDIAQQTVPFGATTANVFQLALAGDGTTVILLANEATAPGLTKSHVEITAVDVSGATRWTTPLDVTLPYDPATLTTHYGVFVDGSGTVVVTAGAVTGIDLATGAVLWTVQAPNAHACLRPAVLGAGGAILASQCDGTVFLARDP